MSDKTKRVLVRLALHHPLLLTLGDGDGAVGAEEAPVEDLDGQLHRLGPDVRDGGVALGRALRFVGLGGCVVGEMILMSVFPIVPSPHLLVAVELDAGLLRLGVHGQDAHLLEVRLQLCVMCRVKGVSSDKKGKKRGAPISLNARTSSGVTSAGRPVT
jgi:hypothetical protein